jgi:hypothetical protein
MPCLTFNKPKISIFNKIINQTQANTHLSARHLPAERYRQAIDYQDSFVLDDKKFLLLRQMNLDLIILCFLPGLARTQKF